MFDKMKCGLGIHKWSEWELTIENSCKLTRHCLRCPDKETKEGEHNWSGWKYASKEACDISRYCLRCSEQEVKKDAHSWGEWEYINELEKKSLLSRKVALSKERDDIFKEYTSEKEDKIKVHKKNTLDAIDSEIMKLELQLKQRNNHSEPCKQIRTCEHCNQEQFQLKHNMTPANYISSDNCKKVKVCKNDGCNYKEDVEEEHVWGIWQYEAPNSCIQIRNCTRCNKSEHTAEKHIWSEWQVGLLPLDPCKIARRCEHCGKIDDKMEYQHSWGQWEEYEFTDENIIYNRRKQCSRCKKSIYGAEHEGVILTSIFFDHYQAIAAYIADFNSKYAKKYKKEIISGIENIAEFNNNRYPSLEVSSLPAITQIVEMLKNSSEEEIRIASMKAIMRMRRQADSKSEEILRTLFQVASITDSSKKIGTLAKSYLQKFNFDES